MGEMIPGIKKKYEFNEYKLDADAIPAVGGVYIITTLKRVQGTNVIYVGQSDDIHRRIGEHQCDEKTMKCWKSNAIDDKLFLWIHRTGSESNCPKECREKIETDLIEHWAPPCNDKHNPKA